MNDSNSDPNHEAILSRIASSSGRFSSATGASLDGEAILIRYFSRDYRIATPEFTFSPRDISPYEQSLVLHYLAGNDTGGDSGAKSGAASTGSVPAADYSTFQSLPSGMFYYGPFRRRTVDRLLPVFGVAPDIFKASCRALGGREASIGDISFRFEGFPKIEVIFSLYFGDDEFPPEMKILFPNCITTHLTLEDVAVLAGIITSNLLRSAPSS